MYRSQEKEGVRVVTAWQAGAAAPVEHPPEIKSRKTGILPLAPRLAPRFEICLQGFPNGLHRDSDKRLRNKSRSGHEERVLTTQKCLAAGGNGRAFDARYLLDF